METHPTGAGSPHESEGANPPSPTNDAASFAHEAELAGTAGGAPHESPHGAEPGEADSPLTARIRRPYGEPQLRNRLPTTPIPFDPPDPRLGQVPDFQRRHLARCREQGRQATATEDRFRALDPRNPAQGRDIHNAAIDAYRHPDASMHSLNTAYQADNQAEHTAYHNLNPLARLSAPSPTGQAVNRAVAATQHSRNAGMMSETIRRDEPTQRSYQRHADGFSLRRFRAASETSSETGNDAAVRQHTDRLANTDPNYHIAENERFGGTELQSRPDPADPMQPNESAFFRTEHPARTHDNYYRVMQSLYPPEEPIPAEDQPEGPEEPRPGTDAAPLYPAGEAPPAHPASHPPPYDDPPPYNE